MAKLEGPLTPERLQEIKDQLPRRIVLSEKLQLFAEVNGIDLDSTPVTILKQRYEEAMKDMTKITTINYWVENALVLATKGRYKGR